MLIFHKYVHGKLSARAMVKVRSYPSLSLPHPTPVICLALKFGRSQWIPSLVSTAFENSMAEMISGRIEVF